MLQLGFHFHFLRITVLPFQEVNKVVCQSYHDQNVLFRWLVMLLRFH